MKKRIDMLLVDRGYAKSREKAKVQVIAGNVRVDGTQVKQPSQQYEEDVVIEIKKDACPYVSRGGLKLERALQEFAIQLQGKICADIGASTGGFTDCMLKNGANFVYAVDVGYGQFDWGLRNDERVELHERTNARYLEAFPRKVDFVSVDVSFISLALLFPAILKLGSEDMEVVTLIKPQFEAGKDKVGKKGVVKLPEVHIEVIETVKRQAAECGLVMTNLTHSPVKGPNGNIEYLARYFICKEEPIAIELVKTVVGMAHSNL